jgi:hypothetical protein
MGAGVIAMKADYRVNATDTDTVDGSNAGHAVVSLSPAGNINVDDRRREPRRCGIDEHGVHRARVRPGIDVSLLDVSAGGALIETSYRLLPGGRVVLQLSCATSALSIRSAVLRCAVCHLSADSIVYRGALIFERRLRWRTDGTGTLGVLLD